MAELNKVTKALLFADNAHKEQKRKNSNLPYIFHPIQVYHLLRMVSDDQDVLIAGLLHDTIEDCGITYDEIKHQFGDRVANLVKEVTNDNQGNPQLKTKEGLMIKLVDILHNISDNNDTPYLKKKIKFVEGI